MTALPPPEQDSSRLRVLLVLVSFSFAFLITEFIFRVFFVPSDGFNISLASHRWFERYWRPINSEGYRDREHNKEEIGDRHVLWVVGDSVAAGHGIENVEDRFSDRLQHALGEQWDVFNIALCGWGTGDELRALKGRSEVPQVIVVAYFINDIELAAASAGLRSPLEVEAPGPIVGRFIASSYFLNFFYWRVWRLMHANVSTAYFEYLRSAYGNAASWEKHQAELKAFADFARTKGSRLIFVLFPDLTNVSSSAAALERVQDFLRTEKVEVLNLVPLLRGRSPADLIVNSIDAHPNAATHALVAKLLLPRIRR
jgi:hypothetical protein